MQFYTVRPDDFWLAEATASFRQEVPEKLVRCLWYDGRWRPSELRTLTGQRLKVGDPGRWNRQAGPDFQQAVIEFEGGERLRGDVEIHRLASGWLAHRHHLDARYNQVILHVCLWNDRHVAEVNRADGQPVPQVVLSTWLPLPLSVYQRGIVLEDYPYLHAPQPGRCYQALRQLDLSQAKQFLDRAGDVRLQRRVGRWAERASQVGLPQVMYEAVMRGLGSTGHRQPFQELAQRVPWPALQDSLHQIPPADRPVAAEALLFGLAGLLAPVQRVVHAMDRDTQRYVAALGRFWEAFAPDMRQRARREAIGRQPHVRPADTLERRLAAMAQLLVRYQTTTLLEAALGVCRGVAGQTDMATARQLGKALSGLFEVPGSSYWSRRVYWGGREGRPQRLIGLQRARTVVVDAVLPVLLLATPGHAPAPLRASLLACYAAAPRLPDNSLLRYMARRLLGDDPVLRALVTGARQQQGLLQLFYDHCDNDEGNCQGCAFPLLSES